MRVEGDCGHTVGVGLSAAFSLDEGVIDVDHMGFSQGVRGGHSLVLLGGGEGVGVDVGLVLKGGEDVIVDVE